jgi:hypothetical protein
LIQRRRTAMTPNRRSSVQEPPRHRNASSPAWPAFESRLAEALAVLEEDQFLVITEKSGRAYVQYVGQGSFGVRAECVSNNYLDETHALRAGQMNTLRRIGWSAPTGTPKEALPKRQPEGSPNFFRDFDRPVPYDAVARMAVRSLTEVFEIPHPGYLMYRAFDKKQRLILIPTLGLKREEAAPPPEKGPENAVEKPRAKKPKKKSPEGCPKCGSLDIVPILYGLPGPEMMDSAEKGRIELGGCCVTDNDPQKRCKACGTEFDFQPLRVARRAREKKERS